MLNLIYFQTENVFGGLPSTGIKIKIKNPEPIGMPRLSEHSNRNANFSMQQWTSALFQMSDKVDDLSCVSNTNWKLKKSHVRKVDTPTSFE